MNIIERLHNEAKSEILNGTYDINQLPIFDTSNPDECIIIIPEGCTSAFIELMEKYIGATAEYDNGNINQQTSFSYGLENNWLWKGQMNEEKKVKYKTFGEKITGKDGQSAREVFDSKYEKSIGKGDKKQNYANLKNKIFASASGEDFPTKINFTTPEAVSLFDQMIAYAKNTFPAKYNTLPADIKKYDCIINADETVLFVIDKGSQKVYEVEIADTRKKPFNEKLNDTTDKISNNWKRYTIKIGGYVFITSVVVGIPALFFSVISGYSKLKQKIYLYEGNVETNEILAKEVAKYLDTSEGHYGYYHTNGVSVEEALNRTRRTIINDYVGAGGFTMNIKVLIASLVRMLTGAKYANIIIDAMRETINASGATTVPTNNATIRRASAEGNGNYEATTETGALVDSNLWEEAQKITNFMKRMKLF